MQIAINENNEIVGYATIGKIQNGIECSVDIPSDFAPNKYLLVTNETEEGLVYTIEPVSDYVEPVLESDAQDKIEMLEEMYDDLVYTLSTM